MMFQTFHKYNRLVRRGVAKELTCDICGAPVVTRLGELDSIVLWCYSCNLWIIPGVALCERVKAIVEEWFPE